MIDKKNITIAIDAMGGDFGAEPILEGLIQALEEVDFKPIVVGDRDIISSYMPQYYLDKVEIVHATDVIGMDEAATDARKRKESSIYKAIELVKEKKAHGVVSAGHSGATMALASLIIKRLPHVNKPALATLMPHKDRRKTLVLDVGAVTDCKPLNLYEFGVMGGAYAQEVMGIKNPKIGLLSNGEEDTKGNELTKEAFKLMQDIDGFIGNVEGRDIFTGNVDVVVTDGFTGNVLLKTSEGVAQAIISIMKQQINKSIPAKIGALLMKKRVFADLIKQIDYAEYGGAPLLGINGCVIVSHGKSNAKAIKNAIFQAINFASSDINKKIEETLIKHNNS
ncbi:MAG: phosphate acyltransferase PlsX [Epsilonproteobacteria bacterium]|nr:phosphate acyltransferase PlsX [Campylobacterota bacterium]